MKCQPLCEIIILLVTQNYCFEFTRCLIPVFFVDLCKNYKTVACQFGQHFLIFPNGFLVNADTVFAKYKFDY
jgi:hypothetical protein